jgi:hypothetical protein
VTTIRIQWPLPLIAMLLVAETAAAAGSGRTQGAPWESPNLTAGTADTVASGMLEAPGPRHKPTVVYDPVRRRLLIFSGLRGMSCYDDVWEMTVDAPGRWRRVETRGAAPAGRFGHTAVYDPVRDRMIVFGGALGAGSVSVADVWELLLSHRATWRRMTPTGTPPAARFAHTAVYDQVRGRMIVFGGFDGRFENDVWALSLGTLPSWSRLTPAGTPPRVRDAHVAIYDPVRHSMVVQGGFDGAATLDDAWALSLSGPLRWHPLDVAQSPPPRRQHAAVYDAARDGMVIFGGNNGTALAYGDAWFLPLAGEPSWRQMDHEGSGPPPRWGPVLARDPVRDCLYVFGGTCEGGWFNDTWRFEPEPEPRWTRVP